MKYTIKGWGLVDKADGLLEVGGPMFKSFAGRAFVSLRVTKVYKSLQEAQNNRSFHGPLASDGQKIVRVKVTVEVIR